MNQIWIVSSICIDRATLEILFPCVSWFARKLAHRQTDRHGDNISIFFPMKKALKKFQRNSLGIFVVGSNFLISFQVWKQKLFCLRQELPINYWHKSGKCKKERFEHLNFSSTFRVNVYFRFTIIYDSELILPKHSESTCTSDSQ